MDFGGSCYVGSEMMSGGSISGCSVGELLCVFVVDGFKVVC